MGRWLTRIAPFTALLALSGSSLSGLADAVFDHRLALQATAIPDPNVTTAKGLRFVRGWRLRSRDRAFGGLSALLANAQGLTALSDKGALFAIDFRRGIPAGARVRPLPEGCGGGVYDRDYDTESLARDPAGNVWIGFEWRNAICRVSPALDRAATLAMPEQMRLWPKAGGAEAMTRLRDGRMIVLAERSNIGRKFTPLLIFATDPTAPGARARKIDYFPPDGYRPTDIAELPNGSLLILHRRFRAPFGFATIVSVLPARALSKAKPLRSRALALLKPPGVSDNFEGLAIEERAGRTYLWLVSDDNFSPLQETYLLKFELMRR